MTKGVSASARLREMQRQALTLLAAEARHARSGCGYPSRLVEKCLVP